MHWREPEFRPSTQLPPWAGTAPQAGARDKLTLLKFRPEDQQRLALEVQHGEHAPRRKPMSAGHDGEDSERVKQGALERLDDLQGRDREVDLALLDHAEQSIATALEE